MKELIYNQAAASLGKHLTLDPSVPEDVGCAEAVSTVLKAVGVRGIPQRGFASTDDLCEWLSTNAQFKEVPCPMVGAVIISPTEGRNTGHTGICLKYGIGSNTSSNGIFSENYSFDAWVHSFTAIKGLKTRYFLAD